MGSSDHNWDLDIDQTIPIGMTFKIDGKIWRCSRCGYRMYNLRLRPPSVVQQASGSLEEAHEFLTKDPMVILTYFSCDELTVIKIMES